MEGADLHNAYLFRADLEGANLYKANLSKAVLKAANLSDANLTKANLSDANLTRANLSNANIFSADLQQAHLIGADLRETNLTAANLTGADLRGSIFEEEKKPKGTGITTTTPIPTTSDTIKKDIDSVVSDTDNSSDMTIRDVSRPPPVQEPLIPPVKEEEKTVVSDTNISSGAPISDVGGLSAKESIPSPSARFTPVKSGRKHYRLLMPIIGELHVAAVVVSVPVSSNMRTTKAVRLSRQRMDIHL